ncbi:MAG: protein-methionine-sulfoxide reductase heme-binding subunit MsrQ [Gammaproteobacteria bacterium]|nr:protein-methionine-sulfoxide reductase heme-binding subunit MsrQ [Gammaproteobacteria bacterium]
MHARYVKPLVFAACLIPLAWLILLALTNQLGANPIEKFTRGLGDWALRLLLITLCVTPLRKLMGWNGLIKLRRMLGLFAFFYVCLHFLSYLVLDQFFAWDEIVKDIIKRPFITVGFIGFVLLIPLAITSTNNMVKRLGGERWRQLHRLVYLIGITGVLHYFWMVKADLRQPLWYAVALTLLLGYRLWLNVASRDTRRSGRVASGAALSS